MLMWRSCADKEYKCSLELGESLYMQTYRAIHMPENQQNSGETHLAALRLHRTLVSHLHIPYLHAAGASRNASAQLITISASGCDLQAQPQSSGCRHTQGPSRPGGCDRSGTSPARAGTEPCWPRDSAWGALPWPRWDSLQSTAATQASSPCRRGGIPLTWALRI